MTKLRDLEQMQAVCEAHYALRQADFAKLVAEENRLRGELRRLDMMGQEAQADALDHTSMQAIGADVIWQGWLGRSKVSVNMALARVLAMKEHHIKEVRAAYGKLVVAKELVKDAKTALKKKASESVLSDAIEMSLTRWANQ